MTGLVPVQVPDWHVSVCVHELPSVQPVPSFAAGFEQTPVPGLHVPATWHWSSAVQVTGFAPVQIPAWQVSVWVQELPSVHDVPLFAGGFEHTPVLGLHVPATWHWSSAVQVTPAQRSVPAQTPAVQTSLVVLALPSSHVVPSDAFGFEHTPVPGLHVPATWH